MQTHQLTSLTDTWFFPSLLTAWYWTSFAWPGPLTPQRSHLLPEHIVFQQQLSALSLPWSRPSSPVRASLSLSDLFTSFPLPTSQSRPLLPHTCSIANSHWLLSPLLSFDGFHYRGHHEGWIIWPFFSTQLLHCPCPPQPPGTLVCSPGILKCTMLSSALGPLHCTVPWAWGAFIFLLLFLPNVAYSMQLQGLAQMSLFQRDFPGHMYSRCLKWNYVLVFFSLYSVFS